MKDIKKRSPALVVEYTDPEEGFSGWLVIDSLDHRLCAGGMRVQKGLSRDHLVRMARNMTCKMRICGLRVDGAKSGIDYDPASPGKGAAMSRFLAAISPYVRTCYSMGPDLNVDMSELEEIGRDLGLASVKMAVAAAQGWGPDRFSSRYRVLTRLIDGRTLGSIRAGYGVSAAVLAVFEHLGTSREQATVAIQGFGTLARAAAYGLWKHGVAIIGLADCEKSIVSVDGRGLDVGALLESSGSLLPEQDYGEGVQVLPSRDICRVTCDVLMPAAVENTITAEVADRLEVRAVVPGANLAVTDEADRLLFARGIVVLPDLLTGSGGSLSMEGLFGPETDPEPEAVLGHVQHRMMELVWQNLARSAAEKITPTQAALRTCAEVAVRPGTRPYGNYC